MTISSRKEAIILFLGDIICFVFSLWCSLAIRYVSIPDGELFFTHLRPFSLIFIVWLLIFYIFGLYGKHTLVFKDRLPNILLQTQVVNSLVAVLFFYFTSYFIITPKITLIIFLFLSFGLVLLWRIYGVGRLTSQTKQNAILVGSGPEMQELLDEVNHNSRYNLHFISFIDLHKVDSRDFYQEVINKIYAENISVVVIDIKSEKVQPMLSKLYNLMFSDIRFVDKHKVYEEIFDRVPISLVKDSWFLENVSLLPKPTYDLFKRVMDISVSLVLGAVALLLLPFIWLAIKIEDGGPVFYYHDRIGKGGKIIRIAKFRTLPVNPEGHWLGGTAPVMRVGSFLRKSRLDELPQLWNVFKGDLSLIGPRPELPPLVRTYEQEISYYGVRHLVTPGLSGWAQIHQSKVPHHGVGIDETKIKLSYDLYYLKNRSFFLDLRIALKTLVTLLSRAGI